MVVFLKAGRLFFVCLIKVPGPNMFGTSTHSVGMLQCHIWSPKGAGSGESIWIREDVDEERTKNPYNILLPPNSLP